MASISRHGVDPTTLKPDTRYIGLEHIPTGGGTAATAILGEFDLASTKFAFTDRHVLFGKLRPNLGKVSRPGCSGVCSTDILPILPGARLDAGYLAWFLRRPEVTAWAAGRTAGANLPRLSPAELVKLRVPLPPLEEQRRIAAILDQADSLRAKRREALAAVEALTRSIFVSVFGHPLVNDRGWPERELQELGRIVTGKTPPTAEEAMFGGPIPFVTPGDLSSGRPPKRTLTDAGASHSRVVRRGATLVCCIGATIGKVGRAECASAFNQQINAVEWNEAVHDAYGYASLEFRRGVIAAAGTSTTLPLLNKSDFQRLRIPVPPSGLQLEYARQVRLAERVATDHSTQLDQFDVLFASLQDRAFKGEL